MKRTLWFPCILCLIIGLLLGILLPTEWLTQGDQKPPSSANVFAPISPAPASPGAQSANSSQEDVPLTLSDNVPLLNTACSVNLILLKEDYAALSGYVHPELGVTFTPYSTVDRENDLCFTAAQIKGLAQDKTIYTWGIVDGRGDPIRMTMEDYFHRYVYDADYTQAGEIGIDRIITSGNALENISAAYSDCRFVDFCLPSADPVNNGLDWHSLKLVFQPMDDRWFLVGIVHGEWTI